jgi:hypothetical protein
LNSGIKKGKLDEAIRDNPRLVYPLRLSLGLSQREFLNKVDRCVSHVSLISYEKGKRKRMSASISKEIVKSIPLKEIDFETVWKYHKKFNDMKLGKHMTSKRGQELQSQWMKKTSKEQRQDWGRKGAILTNQNPRLTSQEAEIKNILEKKLPKSLAYKMHQQVPTEILDINVDFVVLKQNKPIAFIEATRRKHDLTILAQAYAYRKRLLAEAYPQAKNIIIIDELPSFARRILEKEYDSICKTTEFRKIVLKQHT